MRESLSGKEDKKLIKYFILPETPTNSLYENTDIYSFVFSS